MAADHDVQQAMPERNTRVAADNNRIELRTGINLGDVTRPRLLVACVIDPQSAKANKW